jgi:Rad3-related DNA helicase
MFDIESIDQHFPKQSYRLGQKECIEFALKSFNSGKRFVVLECPTGSGKSAIGMTLANMVSRSYYLTSSKILQDQLVKDFTGSIVELKGRASYPCTFWDRKGQSLVDKRLMSQKDLKSRMISNANCNNGFCKTSLNFNKNKFACRQCFTPQSPIKGDLVELSTNNTYSDCPYYEQIYQAINGPRVVMNFSSFLYQTQMTKRFDSPRDLLIIDECHNTESQLLDFVSLTISDYHLRKHGIVLPACDSVHDYVKWFEQNKIHVAIHNAIKAAEEEENSELTEDLTRLFKKYKTFMDTVHASEWVVDVESKSRYTSAQFRPVFVKLHSEPLLFRFAEKVLMMSATVLDVNVVCESLGIDRSQVAAYRMKSSFPVKNRPIYINTVAKMVGGKSQMHEWAPKLLNAVVDITDKYKNKKGIIHTHNFAIMDYVLEKAPERVRKRLLDQRKFNDKSEMLEHHALTKDSIIIAPAMHEGVDLKDDLSRFQIICKVPYPNCFDDKQLARRVEIDRRYYTWLVALKIVQSYGRSIRSEDDFADTYIIDESITKFLRETKNMIPVWFTEALVYP